MRAIHNISGLGILLIGSLLSTQTAQGQARPQFPRPQVQQNAADFAPDPPPIGVPTTPPQARPMPTPTPAPSATQQATELLPPPTPPQVSYRDGLLTVEAANSTLGSILIAIRNKAGIQFEGLENGAPEHVVIAMGPAPAGEVLAAILGGTNFDYVVVERLDSPGIVQRVLLTPKPGTPAATAAAAPPNTAANASGDDDDDAEASDEPAQPQDTPIRPPIAQQVSPPLPQAPAQPRTQEQMIEEMRRRAQQQQQQAFPNTTPVKPPTPE